MKLSNWQFATEGNQTRDFFLKNGVSGRNVTLPHTWSVEEANQHYVGAAWYQTKLVIETVQDVNLLCFGAAFHTAEIYVNGMLAATHSHSGYTPFEVEISKQLKTGDNLIAVRCDNSYSPTVLPFKTEYDWASDGGLIREAAFVQAMDTEVKGCGIRTAVRTYHGDGTCDAAIDVTITLYGAADTTVPVTVHAPGGGAVFQGTAAVTGGQATLTIPLQNGLLWSPETPVLYTLQAAGKTQRFGIRTIRVEGKRILLNGQETKLVGIEWMPGSDPACGMAETPEISARYLQLLKEAHCNFTRFHWQQADYIYDWCDENGLMVQEEIPFWGSPKAAGPCQLDIAKQHAKEMVAAHKNHPSILCWGVGNELGARKKETIFYVKEMVSYFKQLDPTRLVNYVSNTLGHHGKQFLGIKLPFLPDATIYGDICMWNEYMGTWYGPCNRQKEMQYVCKQTEGKPFMVVEFGLCEPAFKGGDPKRSAIYQEKVALYKQYGLNGWIYFSLNDYRTHMGEQGDGKWKQRVHGSTDLCGKVKPSYEIIKQQNRAEFLDSI